MGANAANLRHGLEEKGHRDYSHIALSYVIAVYFNQGDSSTLSSLLETYAGYDGDILDRVQYVIVDDGSPDPVTLPPDIDLNILLLRITEDIPWNQPGGRNLGVVHARSDKVLLTDIDHEIPEHTFRRVIAMRDPGRTMYKMRRVNWDGSERKSHPNTFVLSRARFLRLYGYDEEFTGHYGFDDAMFWRWQRNHGTRFLYLPKSCCARRRKVDEIRSYHSLVRDLSHNRPVADRKRQMWKTYGYEAGHSRIFLNFPWEFVEDRQRQTDPPQPGKHPLWTRTWWWRWLVGGTR